VTFSPRDVWWPWIRKSEEELVAGGVFLTMLGGFGREEIQLSNENRAPGCLGYIEDYTAQLYGDYS